MCIEDQIYLMYVHSFSSKLKKGLLFLLLTAKKPAAFAEHMNGMPHTRKNTVSNSWKNSVQILHADLKSSIGIYIPKHTHYSNKKCKSA